MNSPAPVLPADPAQAVLTLIDITAELRLMMERESGDIARLDEPALHTAADGKDALIARYQQAAAEFKSRGVEFRQVDPVLIDRLRAEQEALSLITRDNQHFLRP